MSEIIEVQPAAGQLRAFARWAVAQTPKIRTVSSNAFGVPAALFTEAPEDILIGSLVDGRPYVSPDDEDGTVSGDVHPEPEGGPGKPLPEAAAEPDPAPLDFAPLEDADSGDSDPSDPSGEESEGLTCPDCDRPPFKSDRGLASHRRHAHPEA
ncbi:hypothetical protein [Streptomyces sp. NPDC047070]|uniref:hypothetical protein n=1 Tax=Streptomyces sp. NPDC047070 TaxID=3154923 RepID=UPI00345574A4